MLIDNLNMYMLLLKVAKNELHFNYTLITHDPEKVLIMCK